MTVDMHRRRGVDPRLEKVLARGPSHESSEVEGHITCRSEFNHFVPTTMLCAVTDVRGSPQIVRLR
jgi:hypothetical protein